MLLIRPRCHSADHLASLQARVPSCPLCGAAVSIPFGVNPNIPMDAHLTSSCPVLNSSTGLAHDGPLRPAKASKPSNVCHYVRCSTKMIVPMRCKDCAHDFCAPHRFPKDHACKAAASSKSSSGRSTPTNQLDPQRRAALAAVKRALRSPSFSGKPNGPGPSAPTAPAPGPSSHPGSRANPIVLNGGADGHGKISDRIPKLGLGKVDRRAKAEEESRRKALEFRAKKGCVPPVVSYYTSPRC